MLSTRCGVPAPPDPPVIYLYGGFCCGIKFRKLLALYKVTWYQSKEVTRYGIARKLNGKSDSSWLVAKVARIFNGTEAKF